MEIYLDIKKIKNMKEQNKTIMVTGGCGFVGHHIVEDLLRETDWDIVVIDKLTYAANGFDRLRDIRVFDEKRVKIFTVDLQKELSEGVKQEIGKVDYILNMASESHVDNSISDPINFVLNNVRLVLNMLEFAKEIKPEKFIQFSTDEVYGTAPEGVNYKEGDRQNPGNPYSASKAAQEAICRAYANTYKIPIVITNGMNIIGERQHPEKYVPLVINKVLKGESITVHSNPDKTKAGTRFYIHARNVAKAIRFIIGNTSETLNNVDASIGQFNIVGEKELDNLELARLIANIVNEWQIEKGIETTPFVYEMVDFHSSRPGHDLRYSLSGDKMKNLGWSIPVNFEESLTKTVRWFLENQIWLKK